MSPVSNLTWSAKPLSAEEAATTAIRDAILSGRLVPGQRLAQAELAAQLGVSRIPLRDALRRLDGDLVTIDGRRGCWVTSLGIGEIEEIYEIRIVLESLCASLAVAGLSDEEAQYLFGLSEQMDLTHSDAHSGSGTRRAFYAELYSYANRPRMRGLILQLRDNVGRYHVLKDVRHSVDAHKQLRCHIMDRNPDGAAEVVVAHLEEARDDLLATMDQGDDVAVLATEES